MHKELLVTRTPEGGRLCYGLLADGRSALALNGVITDIAADEDPARDALIDRFAQACLSAERAAC